MPVAGHESGSGPPKKAKKKMKAKAVPANAGLKINSGAPASFATGSEPAAEPPVLLEDMSIDDGMTSAFEYDLEKLQVMKAKTMYEMVEEIDVGKGPIKVLFLTNPQAESIGSSPQTLRKLLEAFEIPAPKLVINLMPPSLGLRAWLDLYEETDFQFSDGMSPDLFHNKPPFRSFDEKRQTLASLETFMSDIILPLAVATQAIILADALESECALSTAFSHAYRMNPGGEALLHSPSVLLQQRFQSCISTKMKAPTGVQCEESARLGVDGTNCCLT